MNLALCVGLAACPHAPRPYSYPDRTHPDCVVQVLENGSKRRVCPAGDGCNDAIEYEDGTRVVTLAACGPRWVQKPDGSWGPEQPLWARD